MSPRWSYLNLKDCGCCRVADNAEDLPTLQDAPSVWIDHLELRLVASVTVESLLRRILRLCLEPKKVPLLAFGEDSEELGDWDFLLLILVLFFNGIHTIFGCYRVRSVWLRRSFWVKYSFTEFVINQVMLPPTNGQREIAKRGVINSNEFSTPTRTLLLRSAILPGRRSHANPTRTGLPPQDCRDTWDFLSKSEWCESTVSTERLFRNCCMLYYSILPSGGTVLLVSLSTLERVQC